jgi:hypothetical protein
MLVRVLGLAAIVLGSLLWITGSPYSLKYLNPHIAIGFCVVAAVFVMSVLAIAKRAVVPGVIALLLAVVLPIAGFMQLEHGTIAYHSMGAIQLAHLAIALSMIGLAERLYSALGRLR